MSETHYARADAHIHLFKQGYHADYGSGWARTDEVHCYDALREKHGIARALVVGYEGAPAFAGNNRHLASWGKSHSWMAPLCYINCQRIPSLTTLRQPFVGVALYIETEEDAAQILTWPQRIYQKFNERRALISINAPPPILQKIAPFIDLLENCAVLISHLGLPGSFAEPPTATAAAKALKPLISLGKRDNVHVKVSGLYAVSDPSYAFPHRSAVPLLKHIYQHYGAARLLWGSDFSPCLEHISFVQSVEALEILNEELNWPEREMRKIRGQNLLRLLEGEK